MKMFKKVLDDILVEIESKRSKDDCLEECIKNKLDRSTEQYISNLDKNISYILSRSNYKVLKNVSKQQKHIEKETKGNN